MVASCESTLFSSHPMTASASEQLPGWHDTPAYPSRTSALVQVLLPPKSAFAVDPVRQLTECRVGPHRYPRYPSSRHAQRGLLSTTPLIQLTPASSPQMLPWLGSSCASSWLCPQFQAQAVFSHPKARFLTSFWSSCPLLRDLRLPA